VRKQAVKLATAECLKRGILTDFLNIHAKEIVYMMTGPITVEDMKECWQEEAWEEALAKGKAEGMEKGKAEGMAEILAMIDRGVPPDEIRKMIANATKH